MPTETEYEIYREMLDSINRRTKHIEEALLGTFESPGLITKFDARITRLEKTKKTLISSVLWFSCTIITAIIGSLMIAII